MKTKHYKSVHVATNVYNNDGRVKVRVSDSNYNGNLLVEFMIPATSLEKVGNSLFVPKEILKARCKHDANFTFDHWSGGSI